MSTGLSIRPIGPVDLPVLETLYPAAFPGEDLMPLLHVLTGRADVLSLIAEQDGKIRGHIAVTGCHVEDLPVSLLGPLAVHPLTQRQGLGQALVKEGVRRVSEAGHCALFVLGDPAYYSRFGFSANTHVQPPCPIPEAWREAWQCLPLNARALPPGKLRVPAPWQDPALWAPA